MKTILQTNVKVNTPFGVGIVQGCTHDTEPVKWLVRIPIHDDNRDKLNDPRCWTKRATHLALFEFEESELS